MAHKYLLFLYLMLFSFSLYAQDEIQGPPPFWKIKGNIGTDSTLHFIGTTDAIPFRIYTNNTERGRIQYNTGNFGWNTTTPASKLDINGDIALREGTAIACVAGNNAITLAGENSFYRLTGAAGAFAINTITGGNDGQLLFLINDAGQTLTVNNNNAANGILTGTGANLIGVGTTNQSVLLIYNATLARWVVTSSSGFYDKNDWHTKGNTDTEINSPLPPATYGTSTIAVTENWIGTQSTADDFVIGTANIERARFLGNDGKLGIGTAAPSANFLMTVNPTTNALRSGIDIPMLGASSTAYGINIIASNQQMNGLRYENTGTGLSNSFSGVAAVLSGARNVSGYLAYRTNTGKTYGVFGITGTNASYAQADSVWAGNYKGRVHIGLNDPVTPLSNNIDLEVRNTTTNQPSTTLLRQTSSNATAGTVLANLNFGDNYTPNPQAQIQVIRENASSGSADLSTKFSIKNIKDNSNTLLERLRVRENGIIEFDNNNQDAGGAAINYPTYSGTGGFAVGWNANIGSGEVSLWNNANTGSGRGFSFYQQLSASTNEMQFRIGRDGSNIIFARAPGYMLVGNPSPPNVPAGYDIIYQDDFEGDIFWNTSSTQVCPTGNDRWGYSLLTSGDLFTTALSFNTRGARTNQRIESPSIWIPTYFTSFYITDNSRSIGTGDEDGFDGVFLEWKDEGVTGTGTTWSTITTFNLGGYAGQTATGSNTACSGDVSQACWDFNDKGTDYGLIYDETTNINSTGRYVRIGYRGIEDNSADDETFYIYDIVVYGNRPAFSGTFTAGSLYAQGPIFASVQYRLGDLAEYFKVDTNTEPGDIISISSNKKDEYTKAKGAYNDFVIGVHSTQPSVTLNSPNEGVPVALSGRVPVKVNNQNGEIKIGDYLTMSFNTGEAMKADKPCFAIGRALENFNGKEGKILCMVQPGWTNVFSTPSSTSGGSFYFTENTNKVKVIDQSIQKNSRVFVSFRAFAGSEYKISEINDGYFTIELKSNTIEQIPFDYFVDNASIKNNSSERNEVTIVDNIHFQENNDSDTQTPVSKKNDKTIDNPIKISPEVERKFPSKEVRTIEAPIAYDTQGPPTPPDKDKVWFWTKEKGFFTQADLKNSTSRYKEIENQKKITPQNK